MLSDKRKIHRLIIFFIGIISLLLIQFVWVYFTYKTEKTRFMTEVEDAFALAYQKEQTYRIPVVDIVNPGAVTIQSCGSEEIVIIRKCPDSDTIVYKNISGYSIEGFINRVFGDLREQIVPVNIYCLSDLFAGILHDKDIPMSFVIERFDTETENVLETTLLPGKEKPEMKPEATMVLEISNTEAVRAILQLSPKIVLGRITGTLLCTACLVIIAILCFIFLYRCFQPDDSRGGISSYTPSVPNGSEIFRIGKYNFDPGKNELQGFGESVQLNKKENSILYALCTHQGNVVERSVLLEENWGNHGAIYSRSLDTYIATLRKYLKQDAAVQIVTVKSVGYKLVY